MAQRAGRKLARHYGIMVTDAWGIRRKLPSPKVEEPSGPTKCLKNNMTLFDAKTVKKWDKVDLTDDCTVVCEGVGSDRLHLRIEHNASHCQEKMVVGFFETQEDDWVRKRVTDGGMLIWLRGRDGKIEAKAGPAIDDELPDFQFGDEEAVRNIGTTLWEYRDEKPNRRIPVGGNYFLKVEGSGHMTSDGRVPGEFKSATINFSLQIANKDMWHTPYNREFTLSGFGSGKSFLIDGVMTDVVLTVNGISVRSGEIRGS